MDAHHKEALEYQFSMEGQLHVPPLVNVNDYNFQMNDNDIADQL
jgi:hypothetical protein